MDMKIKYCEYCESNTTHFNGKCQDCESKKISMFLLTIGWIAIFLTMTIYSYIKLQ